MEHTTAATALRELMTWFNNATPAQREAMGDFIDKNRRLPKAI